ncbi:hypothetical protein ABW20_dc0108930 [Dactylellina cionopaga]|nr:hypothetical protein ABW20_dc0108930 [Dactylellina cionopaga]
MLVLLYRSSFDEKYENLEWLQLYHPYATWYQYVMTHFDKTKNSESPADSSDLYHDGEAPNQTILAAIRYDEANTAPPVEIYDDASYTKFISSLKKEIPKEPDLIVHFYQEDTRA